MAKRLRRCGVARDDAVFVAAFLAMEDVFGPDPPRHAPLRAELVRAVSEPRRDGPFAAVRARSFGIAARGGSVGPNGPEDKRSNTSEV